jgi:hypothetical protein
MGEISQILGFFSPYKWASCFSKFGKKWGYDHWWLVVDYFSISTGKLHFFTYTGYQVLRFFKFSVCSPVSTCWNNQPIRVSIYLFFLHIKTGWYAEGSVVARPCWELNNIVPRLVIKQFFFKQFFFFLIIILFTFWISDFCTLVLYHDFLIW